MNNAPTRVAVEPADSPDWLREAVLEGGGAVTPLAEAEALVWFGGDHTELAPVITGAPHLRWVQLAHAGIESFADAIDDDRIWTCAKEAFSTTVAEQALALILGILRNLAASARARSWARTETRQLTGMSVLIVGGGGIGRALCGLLAPFAVSITIAGRTRVAASESIGIVPLGDLASVLPDADVVVLALPLTDETHGLIAERELQAMKSDAILVNVARGGLVVTDDLLRALKEGWIAGAGLDVTDPEPLPDGHPLWDAPDVLITSHSANSPTTYRAQLHERVRQNVERFSKGTDLLGVVDPVSRH